MKKKKNFFALYFYFSFNKIHTQYENIKINKYANKQTHTHAYFIC